MARKPRIHYYGAIYHVIARGNNKEKIFLNSSDKARYLELLERYKGKYNFNLLAYVLMENHIHILIQVKETPLSKIMQGLQLCYTQYFNSKYEHVGHVFQQRYKAILCRNDEYLFTLVKYIHHNPQKAEILDGIDYKWSSHKEYLKGNSKLVETDYILNMFDTNQKVAIKRYMEFMEDGREEDLSLTVADPPLEFEEENLVEHNIQMPVKDLLCFIANKFGVNNQLILTKTKQPNVVQARRFFLHLAITNGLLSRAQAAEYLGLSQSTITKAFNDTLFNEEFKNTLLMLQSELSERMEQSKA